ncbi:3-deoxy-manno-octulosonate-8-phosphatase KdsC [Chitinimonas sp. BJYL2]|uniref:3-deoxy-manno-octulosonate-8-phosphatase KdsC n=1 Tax=Chitinimonas sp. BJYL2 TaxID=2976696 RepID=UPI0022B596FD|nr:3-deoxy-manno-octulosonate-8-phosphatase KdsC [Chitinimonas sp. BJYL2]
MQERAQSVRLMIFDVDGVMTDGSLYYTDAGEELKAFNSLDGHGLKMLQQSGVQLAIITGRNSRLVEHRARNLGINHLIQGAHDKRASFEKLLADLGFRPEDCGYMGDDVIDLPVMRRVHFAVAVPDSPVIVRQHAHYVTGARGGHGAVREVCDMIMQAQGTLDAQLAPYLQ